MCRGCLDLNKLGAMDTTILGQHRPFMSIKSFVQHSGWQELVSLCSLIRLIGMCSDRDQPEFLCSRSDSRYLEVHVATAGGWLTRYRPREVRNSVYRYRKIHIDYRSKFLYRFISTISIIYGNTIYNGCSYLSMLGLTFIHVVKRGPRPQWVAVGILVIPADWQYDDTWAVHLVPGLRVTGSTTMEQVGNCVGYLIMQIWSCNLH